MTPVQLYLGTITGKILTPKKADVRILNGTLPKNITVDGDLYFGSTNISKLPDGLTVNGCMNLFNCSKLTSLPENLTIKRYLNIDSCINLTCLPDTLRIDGNIFLGGYHAEFSTIGKEMLEYLILLNQLRWNARLTTEVPSKQEIRKILLDALREVI